jgi:glycosyltransferase involved in cell wall biosynthesis
MLSWPDYFCFHDRTLLYNRIPYNNASERTLEVTLGFDFLAKHLHTGSCLEIGNTLFHYENVLSDYWGARSRRVVDKFENERGVDLIDVMDLPSDEKYAAILSLSTVEHVGQGESPMSLYGETGEVRDPEGPLKAIAKIYDLLALNGHAMVTIPYGKLMDFGWLIQFSADYLDVLFTKYGVPREHLTLTTYGKVMQDLTSPIPKQIWRREDPQTLRETEYDFPWKHANGIGILELVKASSSFQFAVDHPPTPLPYTPADFDKAQTLNELTAPQFAQILYTLGVANLLYCPAWTVPEQSLAGAIAALTAVWQHPDAGQITLCILGDERSEEAINRFCTALIETARAQLTDGVEDNTPPRLLWVPPLTDRQWSTLAPQLQGQLRSRQETLPCTDPRLPQFDFQEFVQLRLIDQGYDGVIFGQPTPKDPKPSFKVVLDGMFFQRYNTGIARVWRSLLQRWANSQFAQSLVIIDRGGSAPRLDGLTYRTLPLHSYENPDLERQQLQQICDQENATLFISTYYTIPISTPSVFMAYDMIPEVLGADFSEPMWQEKHRAIEHAQAYIGISQNTLDDLVRCFPDAATKPKTVAHCGVEPIFTPARESEIERFKHKYGIQKPYFILSAPGTGYKNAQLFFRAFAQLPTRLGFELVCTGNMGWLDENLRAMVPGNTIHTLYLDDAELRLAFSGAIALVYPSRYEGFGLPVLEALACGCPIITSPIASLPEVAGEAAIYVNPDDEATMIAALCEVQNPRVRQSLRLAGLQQAQQFSWEKMAQTVEQALIMATVPVTNLSGTNYILTPNWSQSEDILNEVLSEIFKTLAQQKNPITLLFYAAAANAEDVNTLLTGIAFNLMMMEAVDLDEHLAIAILPPLHPIQWSALLPHIQGRIALDCDDTQVITLPPIQVLPIIALF